MECVKCIMSSSVANDNFKMSCLLTVQLMSWEHCVWNSHMWDEFYQIKKPDTWHTIDPEGLEVMMDDFSCVHLVFNDDDDEGWGDRTKLFRSVIWCGITHTNNG
jgi:hypothetical protein